MRNEALTTGQVAEYCQVTYRAVLKWIAEGKLKAYRTPGQHSRIQVKDFIEFLEKYNMPVPEDLLAPGGKKKVLIIDDDPKIVALMRRSLEAKEIYDVRTAGDGFSGGQAFADFKPDLIVLDIGIPGLNGYQVCENIRRDPANGKVRILSVSGIVDADGEKRILELGADAFLAKPLDMDVFAGKVGGMLGVDGPARREGRG